MALSTGTVCRQALRCSAFLLALTIWLAATATAAQAGNARPLKFGLTPVFLDDRAAFLDRWRAYLEVHLRRSVVFVQRASYREITELLQQGGADIAWICGYPYVQHRRDVRLVAVPVYRGRPLYQSYLIVPASDTETRSITDLRGKIFAFSDPDSNSGHLYRQYQIKRMGRSPDTFFARTFYAHAHRNVVEAVAVGLADGGSVDGYVWETLRLYHPELVERTRVVSKSPWFGHPPIVARRGLGADETDAVRRVLTGMADDPDGAALLRELNLDAFSQESPRLFDGIAEMAAYVGD